MVVTGTIPTNLPGLMAEITGTHSDLTGIIHELPLLMSEGLPQGRHKMIGQEDSTDMTCWFLGASFFHHWNRVFWRSMGSWEIRDMKKANLMMFQWMFGMDRQPKQMPPKCHPSLSHRGSRQPRRRGTTSEKIDEIQTANGNTLGILGPC